jgi:hypothetical protein
MQYSSRAGENVLDLFGGSGSTLIAAEQTGRKAFLMELDSPYGRATLGAKPFRRAPVTKNVDVIYWVSDATAACLAIRREVPVKLERFGCSTFALRNDHPSHPPRFAGQAKPTPYGRG